VPEPVLAVGSGPGIYINLLAGRLAYSDSSVIPGTSRTEERWSNLPEIPEEAYGRSGVRQPRPERGGVFPEQREHGRWRGRSPVTYGRGRCRSTTRPVEAGHEGWGG